MPDDDDDAQFSTDLVDGRADLITLHDGTVLRSHGPNVCLGPYCALHKPSAHPLNAAPLLWSQDLRMLFRVCEHDNLHPDPDSLAFSQLMAMVGDAAFYDGWHPCCSSTCCTGAERDEP